MYGNFFGRHQIFYMYFTDFFRFLVQMFTTVGFAVHLGVFGVQFCTIAVQFDTIAFFGAKYNNVRNYTILRYTMNIYRPFFSSVREGTKTSLFKWLSNFCHYEEMSLCQCFRILMSHLWCLPKKCPPQKCLLQKCLFL